jgi:hypothetical protein
MAKTTQISDPVFGDKGTVDKAGTQVWASFTTNFARTDLDVLVLTNIKDGAVPQSQRTFYLDMEEWYAKHSSRVLRRILSAMQCSAAANLQLLTDNIADHLQLESIDIRHLPEGRFVLRYRTDLDVYGWYVSISTSYRIMQCGLSIEPSRI